MGKSSPAHSPLPLPQPELKKARTSAVHSETFHAPAQTGQARPHPSTLSVAHPFRQLLLLSLLPSRITWPRLALLVPRLRSPEDWALYLQTPDARSEGCGSSYLGGQADTLQTPCRARPLWPAGRRGCRRRRSPGPAGLCSSLLSWLSALWERGMRGEDTTRGKAGQELMTSPETFFLHVSLLLHE